MNCLYITNEREENTGGKIISERNHGYLKDIFGANNFYSYTISHPKLSKLAMLIHLFNSELIPLNSVQIQEINHEIETHGITCVFLDNSLLGNIAKRLKEAHPRLTVITFFHNAEYKYFKSLAKTSGKLYHLLTAHTVKKIEQRATAYSDTIVAMNKRDSQDIQQIYNKETDFLLPTTLIDDFDPSKIQASRTGDNLRLLFVGARFFPNEEGIRWFVKEVMPLLKGVELQVVGKGFESLKDELEMYPNVQVIGTVNNPATFYYEQNVVISPIFSGSGMKTKTAEALKYGKVLLATDEALEGYDININLIGRRCNSTQEFVDAIETVKEKTNLFTQQSRTAFLQNYESDQLLFKFKNFLYERLGL